MNSVYIHIKMLFKIGTMIAVFLCSWTQEWQGKLENCCIRSKVVIYRHIDSIYAEVCNISRVSTFLMVWLVDVQWWCGPVSTPWCLLLHRRSNTQAQSCRESPVPLHGINVNKPQFLMESLESFGWKT